MNLTKQQQSIIKSSGHLKINAVAGSGKTTTIIEYAKSRPKGSKILYLAFNRSVKLEAARKFKDLGLHNVKVETAHSLAFKHVIMGSDYKIRPQGYKTHEIAELLHLPSSGEKHAEYIFANHIKKFISYYCNSEKRKVSELKYTDILTDNKARAFATSNYNHIEKQTRFLLNKMHLGEIDMIHDFYLKKFQLSQPKLNFDYILFDEGQDASPAMLDIFFNQDAIKIIVGDTHQQIYGWRHAVNSLEQADFKTHHLSVSFRFANDIANLAGEILKWKSHIAEYTPVPITGSGGNTDNNKTKAVLARTNLGLLLKAIEHVTERKNDDSIYFEGNINSYTYAEDGASLYDVLSLYNGKRRMIRDKLIRQMKDMAELEEYIEKTEDMELGMMVEIVKEYENRIPGLIKKIKERHIDSDDKEKAEMIFSTVHRCKGMEYDTVHLVNDFITEEKVEKKVKDNKDKALDVSKLNEEINLLYVAITRAKEQLFIPEVLMPGEFPESPSIHVTKIKAEEEENELVNISDLNISSFETSKEKAYTVEGVRKDHKDAYRPWTPDLDEELSVMYLEGVKIKDLASHFGRTKGAIRARIKKLELHDVYE